MGTVVRGADVAQWNVFETSFESKEAYANAFTDVEINVVFSKDNEQWEVPAFWAGDSRWTVRFAPPEQGNYTYRVECTDTANEDFNPKAGTLSVHAFVRGYP